MTAKKNEKSSEAPEATSIAPEEVEPLVEVKGSMPTAEAPTVVPHSINPQDVLLTAYNSLGNENLNLKLEVARLQEIIKKLTAPKE